MKILIVTQYFWPETFRINDLAISLLKRGHQITVLTGTPNYPGGRIFKDYGWFKRTKESFKGVTICRVPTIPRGKGGAVSLLLNYMSFVLSACTFGPLMCRSKADIIFVFEPSPITVGIPAIFLKKIKKAPIFFWVQDLWPETLSAVGVLAPTSLIFKLIEKLVESIYSKCNRILTQSQAFEKSISKYNKKVKPIYYFPNSAEKLYKPIPFDKSSSEFEQMPDGFRIMFAGNIGFAQDFETIIATANLLKEHKNIQWVIIGDGRAKPWAEKKLDELGLTDTFHFIGKYPVEKMPIYFSYADALLVTLKKDPIFALTVPAKVQSYLACGKPILAGLDGEGARVVEAAGAGITCGSENPKALAEAIIKMLHMDDNERKKMSIAGRKYFESNFESEMLVSRLEQWMSDEISV